MFWSGFFLVHLFILYFPSVFVDILRRWRQSFAVPSPCYNGNWALRSCLCCLWRYLFLDDVLDSVFFSLPFKGRHFVRVVDILCPSLIRIIEADIGRNTSTAVLFFFMFLYFRWQGTRAFSSTDTTCMFLILVIKGGQAHLDLLSFCIGGGTVEDTRGER